MYTGLHVNYPSFLSDFNETLIFSRDSKKTQTSNFIKIRPVETELFQADRRADTHDEANSCFPKFCETRLKTAEMQVQECLKNTCAHTDTHVNWILYPT